MLEEHRRAQRWKASRRRWERRERGSRKRWCACKSEYYGKGPTKAKTYIVDDLVVVVLEESFTRAEKTLVERGEREAIQQIRRRFQQQMADSFISIVEQATGRRVRTFLSETDVDQDVSVETFLLAEDRTDMTGFEDA